MYVEFANVTDIYKGFIENLKKNKSKRSNIQRKKENVRAAAAVG
jgi:hypothetical protein